jgi:hypothetical protein
MVKRSFVEFAAETEPNLTIITADGARIPAHVDVSEQKERSHFDVPCLNGGLVRRP